MDKLDELIKVIEFEPLDEFIKLYKKNSYLVSHTTKVKKDNILILSLKLKNTDVANWLIDNSNIDIDHINCSGWTAFMWACHLEFDDICNKLINKGVNISIKNNEDYDAFSYINYKNQKMVNMVRNIFETQMTTNSNISNETIKYKSGDIRINNNFPILKGSYGKIHFGHDKVRNKNVVLKEFIKEDNLFDKCTISEIHMLKLVSEKYPDVTSEYYGMIFDEKSERIYVVMERLKCDILLLFKIYDNFDNEIRLPFYKNLFIQIINCLNKLHSIGIIHNDLKSNNIMLDDNNQVKIIDFSISDFCCFGQLKNLTENYLAPSYIKALDNKDDISINLNGEIKMINVDRKSFHSDIYSIGRLFLEAIVRELGYEYNVIFYEENFYVRTCDEKKEKEPYIYIKMEKTLEDKIFNFSEDFYDLMKKMLDVLGTNRIKSDEILNHRFFSNNSGIKQENNAMLVVTDMTECMDNSYICEQILSKYTHYNFPDISFRNYEVINMDSIHKSFTFDKFDALTDIVPTEKSINEYYGVIDNIIKRSLKTSPSIDSLCNTFIKTYNFIDTKCAISNVVDTFYCIGNSVFIFYEFSYKNVNNSNILSVLNSNYSYFPPIFTHIMYMVVELQKGNISEYNLINIYKYIIKKIILYSIFRHKIYGNYNCNNRTIWEIIQSIYYSYFLSNNKKVSIKFDLDENDILVQYVYQFCQLKNENFNCEKYKYISLFM